MKTAKKVLALLLSVLMVFTMVSSSVVAVAETTPAETTKIEDVENTVNNTFGTIKGIIEVVHNLVGGIMSMLGKECVFCYEVHSKAETDGEDTQEPTEPETSPSESEVPVEPEQPAEPEEPTEPEKPETDEPEAEEPAEDKIGNAFDSLGNLFDSIHNLVGGILAIFGKECPFCDEVHTVKGKTFAVKFDVNCNEIETSIPTQIVKAGEMVAVPNIPNREGFVFSGWYTTIEFNEMFDFSTEIYQDYNLIARWVEIPEDTQLDTDKDGLTDLEENCYRTDIYQKDTDNDGVSDYYEIMVLYTDPLNIDTDSNGLNDYEEDFDGDKINNGDEITEETNPLLSDTDTDGLSDFDEKNTIGTNPILDDTDADGATDGWELDNGFDPKVYNESFSIDILPGETRESSPVSAGVSANVGGSGAETLSVTPVSAAKMPELNPSIAGYLGEAFEFNSNEPIESAEITFTYDESLGELSEDFQPRIYYYNEYTGFLEELPNQKIEDGKVSVEVEHFSIYILLNKVEFDSVWNSDIKPPEYDNDDAEEALLDIAFVVDYSLSMDWNDPSQLFKKVSKEFISKLREGKDKATVIKFIRRATKVTKLTSDKEALNKAIDSISYDDGYGTYSGTDGSAGLKMAIDELKTSDSKYQYIVFMTDGEDNGYSYSYDSLISEAVEENIVIYTIGMGSASESVLKKVANGTEGKYYHATAGFESDEVLDLESVFDKIEDETVDYNGDKNDDGISDYYNDLIFKGELLSKTGSTALEGIDFNYDAKNNLNDDFDGDGLDNGDELKIYEDEETGLVYWVAVSNPLNANPDEDPYDDSEEYEIGSDPFYKTYDGNAVKGLIRSDDDIYRSIVNLYNDDVAFKIEQNIFGYGLTDGFIDVAKKQIIEYMYDYVAEDYLKTVEAEMLKVSMVETVYDVIKNANKVIKDTKKYIGKVQEAYEIFAKATELKIKANDLISRINVLTPSFDDNGSYEKLISLLENEYTEVIKELDGIDHTALSKIEIKIYDINQKYKKFLNKKVASDITISDTFTLANLGLDVVDTMITYSKINAITYVFEQNFDILQSIQINAKYFEVATAASLVAYALSNGYTSYVESVMSAIVYDVADVFIDEVTSTVLKTNPIYQGYKLAMFILGVIGFDEVVETVYNMLCYADMFDSTAVLTNQRLEKKYGNKTYGGKYWFYESRWFNDEDSPRYLKHLAQITILAEKAYIEFDDQRRMPWFDDEENQNVPRAQSNIEGIIKSVEELLEMHLPKSLGGTGSSNVSSGGGSR